MNRAAWVGLALSGVVAVAGATWAVASQVMRSPADLAAEASAPEPSTVTVPVERTELVADVVVRATVSYDEALPVTLGGSLAVEGEPVVTRVPEDDDDVDEGDVLLEVSGRPVFVLTGRTPMFRDLRPGMSGEDVEQVQAALDRLGLDVGEVDGVFGPATQAAVEELYGQAGFDAPGPSSEELDRLAQAEERRTSAQEHLVQAEGQLAQAAEGPSRAERLQAHAAVNEAQDALDALPDDASDSELRRAEEGLQIAIAQRDEQLADPDTTTQSRAVDSARGERDEAQAALDRLRGEIGTWVPAGEVVIVEGLPQRVDEVVAERGTPATGDLLTLSSSEVVVQTEIPVEDIDLIGVGDRVLLRSEDGEEFEAELIELADRPGTDGAADDAHAALIEPHAGADELLGTSVRVRIPVQSTDGAVLAVPLVAVSVTADGTSVVEVVNDDTDTDDPDARRLVTVEPGLSADGLVEVLPHDGDLHEGDQVVVGS